MLTTLGKEKDANFHALKSQDLNGFTTSTAVSQHTSQELHASPRVGQHTLACRANTRFSPTYHLVALPKVCADSFAPCKRTYEQTDMPTCEVTCKAPFKLLLWGKASVQACFRYINLRGAAGPPLVALTGLHTDNGKHIWFTHVLCAFMLSRLWQHWS